MPFTIRPLHCCNLPPAAQHLALHAGRAIIIDWDRLRDLGIDVSMLFAMGFIRERYRLLAIGVANLQVLLRADNVAQGMTGCSRFAMYPVHAGCLPA